MLFDSNIRKINSSNEGALIVFVDDVNRFIKKTNSLNIRIVCEFPFIKAVGIMANKQLLPYLTKLKEVKYISSQSTVTALENSNSMFSKVGALPFDKKPDNEIFQKTEILKERKRKYNGEGIGVAFIDTGINPHLDVSLPNRVAAFVDFEDGKTIPYDDNGHGTFVAGVCAGSGLCSRGEICGSAPKSTVISVKVMNSEGEGGAFKVLEGMQWVLDNALKYNIKVCCMSFGSDIIYPNDPLIIGSETLVRNNINVVCASGNSGEGTIKSPAAGPRVISVGSVGNNYNISDFTSRKVFGGFIRPDFYAPGEDIKGLGDRVYTSMSGTSVAAPYVAGICACLCQANPSLKAVSMKRALYGISKKIKPNVFVLDNDALKF